MRRVVAVRYAAPLREGGSLPGLIEADDGRLYVVKMRGAGQGPRALVAELVAGELGRALALRIPEIVLVDLDAAFGRTEPDPEIRELLAASAGVNFGLAHLSGALNYDPAARLEIPSELASAVVAFDAFTCNVDRAARNPNLLWWKGELWLIDHGAALYWHHDWNGTTDGADRAFPLVRDHVLLRWAAALPDAVAALQRGLDDGVIARATAALPADWLAAPPSFASADEHRAAYGRHLRARRDAASTFLEEAIRARARLV